MADNEDRWASASLASSSDYASDSSCADSDLDHEDVSLSLESTLQIESTLTTVSELSMQSMLVLETELEMLNDMYELQSGFSWNLLGGVLVGIATTVAGVVIIVTTGGTALPALGAVLTSAGASGMIFCATSNEETFKWDAFAANMAVSAGITAATLGACQLVMVARGVESLGHLSTAVVNLGVNTPVVAVDNVVKGRSWYDHLHLHAAATFVASYVGGRLGSNEVAGEGIEMTNRELFVLAMSEVAQGAAAGAGASAAANAVGNVIQGENVFANFGEALAIGARDGAISGAVRAFTVTAQTVRNRDFHNKNLTTARVAVENGEPLSSFHLSMYCEHTQECVFVLDTRDGNVYAYGDVKNANRPHLLMFTPGSNGNAGHYERIDPVTLQPVTTKINNGPNTCLADALGVPMAVIDEALTTSNQKLLAQKANLRELYGHNTGGGKKSTGGKNTPKGDLGRLQEIMPKEDLDHLRKIIPHIKDTEALAKYLQPDSKRLKYSQDQLEKLDISRALDHGYKHSKTTGKGPTHDRGAAQFAFKDGMHTKEWAYMTQFATAMEGSLVESTGVRVLEFDFEIGVSKKTWSKTLIYENNHGYPSHQRPKQKVDVKIMTKTEFVQFIGKHLDLYEAYVSSLTQATTIKDRAAMGKALAAFCKTYNVPDHEK
ncbi:hypothetical protein DVH05_027020 [Phytophthora capsici]|nr:hypothetical protein DVH05_027020 [Phytophthora capsici]